MTPAAKRFLGLGLALLVSGVCLYFFLRGMDVEKVWAALRRAHYGWLLLAALPIWASMALRALRWRLLLAGVKPVGVVRLYHLQMIGILATGVLPGRLGEVVKPLLLARRESIPVLATFATVLVERILDLTLVVALTVVMLLLFPFPAATVEVPGFAEPVRIDALLSGLGAAFAVVCAVLLVVVGALVHAPAFFLAVARRLLGLVSARLATAGCRLLEHFMTGLGVFRRPALAARSFGWTLLVWAGIMLSEYLLFPAFGIEVGLAGACLLTAAIALAVALPQAPGFLGVFHLATSLVLVHCFGVDADVAAAYAIVLWFVQMAFLIALGFVSLAVEGVSFAEIRAARDAPEPA